MNQSAAVSPPRSVHLVSVGAKEAEEGALSGPQASPFVACDANGDDTKAPPCRDATREEALAPSPRNFCRFGVSASRPVQAAAM